MKLQSLQQKQQQPFSWLGLPKGPELTMPCHCSDSTGMDQCLVLVGNDIELDPVELDTVGRQFEPYRWHPCGVTWDAVPEQSWLLKLRRKPTSTAEASTTEAVF